MAYPDKTVQSIDEFNDRIYRVFRACGVFCCFYFQQGHQHDIEFAKRELRGVHYILAVKKAALSLDQGVYQSKVSGALNSSLFTTAEDLKRADALYGRELKPPSQRKWWRARWFKVPVGAQWTMFQLVRPIQRSAA
ncbi:MAG: hypothetical protein HC777_01065 [Hyphomonadaceae bacterium]|nr:hypothetical protein [Hyphomonadaceae bacterium]